MFDAGDIDGLFGPAAGPNQDFTATEGGAPAINTVSTAAGTADQNRGVRTYTFNVGTGVTSVDIALIPQPNVTIDPNGNVTFRDFDTNNRADGLGGHVPDRQRSQADRLAASSP